MALLVFVYYSSFASQFFAPFFMDYDSRYIFVVSHYTYIHIYSACTDGATIELFFSGRLCNGDYVAAHKQAGFYNIRFMNENTLN